MIEKMTFPIVTDKPREIIALAKSGELTLRLGPIGPVFNKIQLYANDESREALGTVTLDNDYFDYLNKSLSVTNGKLYLNIELCTD